LRESKWVNEPMKRNRIFEIFLLIKAITRFVQNNLKNMNIRLEKVVNIRN